MLLRSLLSARLLSVRHSISPPVSSRWLVLRICEANTQCLLKVCDLARATLDALYEQVPAPYPSSTSPPVHHKPHWLSVPATDSE